MIELPPRRGIVMENPIVQLDGSGGTPLIGMWSPREGDYRFDLASLDETFEVRPTAAMETILDRFTHRQGEARPDPGEVKVASDRDLVCLAGAGTLAVGTLGEGSALDRVAAMEVEGGPTAIALSAARRSVVFSLADGSVFRWSFDDEGPPECIGVPHRDAPVRGLYLDPEGDALAVLYGPVIALCDLAVPKPPKRFATGGAPVTAVAQSRDKGSLIVSTDENNVMLFSFGLKI